MACSLHSVPLSVRLFLHSLYHFSISPVVLFLIFIRLHGSKLVCLLLPLPQQQPLCQISISFQFPLLLGHALVVAISTLPAPEPHPIPGGAGGHDGGGGEAGLPAAPGSYSRSKNSASLSAWVPSSFCLWTGEMILTWAPGSSHIPADPYAELLPELLL